MIFRLAWKTLGIAAAFCAALTPAISRAQESHAPHWSYEGREDPRHWGSLDPAFAACKMGHNQSPIDIHNPKLTDLPELKMDYKAVPLSIINNGHTIMVNYAPGSTLTVGNKTYSLKQFHFHHPSEELINGKRFDMVGHLVHADEDGNGWNRARLHEIRHRIADRTQAVRKTDPGVRELARRLFERKGFAVVERQDLVIRGVAIHNYRMAKALDLTARI